MSVDNLGDFSRIICLINVWQLALCICNAYLVVLFHKHMTNIFIYKYSWTVRHYYIDTSFVVLYTPAS